jgi:hypothetical protein
MHDEEMQGREVRNLARGFTEYCEQVWIQFDYSAFLNLIVMHIFSTSEIEGFLFAASCLT